VPSRDSFSEDPKAYYPGITIKFMTTTFIKTVSKYITALTAVVFVMSSIVTLSAPHTAYATQCWLTTPTPTITQGQSATIAWRKHNPGEQLTINNGIGLVGVGTTSGTVSVKPNQTTTYTGTNRNAAGHTQTCKVTITVVQPDPVCSMTANTHEITAGENATLRWESSHTTGGMLVPGNSTIASNGSVSVAPTQTTTYTGTFTGINGKTVSCTKTIRVLPPPPSDPVCELRSSNNALELGQSTTLTWSSTNAVSGSMSPIPGAIALSDTLVVSPETTTTYTARFANETGKTVECATTVTVTDTRPWCEVFANPTSIERGQSAVVNWNADNVSAVTFNNGIGAVSKSDQRTVSPTETTTYTGTFVGINGTTIECDATVTVVPPAETPGPVCAMSISPTTVKKDNQATLTWSSSNAVSAVIDRGIGSVDVNGAQGVTVSEDTVYTGTFTHSDGRTVHCTASVRVETGGGGGGGGPCLNCRGDDDDDDDDDDDEEVRPSIVLSRSINLAEPRFITLTEVPYTGFTVGPVGMAAFWLAVVALSAAIAYYFTYQSPFARVAPSAASTDRVTMERRPSAFIARTDAPIQTHAVRFAEPAQSGSGSLEETIEEIAHREHILFSPDALRSVTGEAQRAPMALTKYLDAFIAEVKTHFVKEDGWILLSKERVASVIIALRSAPVVVPPVPVVASIAEAAPAPTPTPVVAQVASAPLAAAVPVPVTAKAPAGTANVSDFVGFLASGKKEDAYATLRNLHATAGNATVFIGETVRALDEVYKHRIEGNHSPDAAVASAVAQLSNQQLEKIIGLLVESVDYSYASNRIGTKVAIAKVFEYFEKTAAQ
jgi:hypothetical protein